jgi:hypothetical protein
VSKYSKEEITRGDCVVRLADTPIVEEQNLLEKKKHERIANPTKSQGVTTTQPKSVVTLKTPSKSKTLRRYHHTCAEKRHPTL